ncbi:MAG TPA: MAPEG family protein [Vineibacter sp.]|nr:MAPEG family protein [Vineibacter sp.]
MGTELSLLTWSVALMFVQVVIAAQGASGQLGIATLAGNREDLPTISGWAGRARRAHLNMLENLVLFAILVLVAKVANKTDGMTALGAHLFFWGRLAYAVLYIAGIPWIRTGAWLVSVVGMVLIFIRLIG